MNIDFHTHHYPLAYLDEIEKHIENGATQYKMQSLDMHLLQLYRQDLITMEDAKRLTHSMDFERKLMFDN